MSNFMSKINFVGEVMIPKKDSNRPFYSEPKPRMASLNFGVKASDSNMAYVESFGSISAKLKTKDNDKNDIEILWEDRFDDEVLKTVANYRKLTVDLGEDLGGKKSFIAEYDFIMFLKEHLPKYKGKVAVTGRPKKEWYKGKYYEKFKMQGVYAVAAERKSQLSLVMDVFYNKECIDKTELQSEKRIYVNGYINQYLSKEEGSAFMPQQFVLDVSKLDAENNEHHKELYEDKLSYVDAKSKTMIHIPWEMKLIRGAEETEFDESMLSDKQKRQIELGNKELKDFKPRGKILGDKVNEYRLLNPQLMGDFADGVVDCGMTNREFEEAVYVPPADEKLSDVVKTKKTDKAVEKAAPTDEPPFEVDSVDDDDLF